MSSLLLSDLIDECQDVKAAYPQAKVVRAANKVFRRVGNETYQPTYSTFTTKAKVTTGTVAVTQDSTTATFSSAVLSTSDPMCLVQIEGEGQWFLLTPSSTTVGALSSKWAAATDAAATYALVYPSISFPAAVGEVLRIWREGLDELKFAADRGSPDVSGWSLGTPAWWSPYARDSSSAAPNDDLRRILLSPAPETRQVWEYAYRPRMTLWTAGGATTQACPLGELWDETVIAGTLCGVYEVRDGIAAAQAKRAEYENAYRRARATIAPAASVKPRPFGSGMLVNHPTPVNG